MAERAFADRRVDVPGRAEPDPQTRRAAGGVRAGVSDPEVGSEGRARGHTGRRRGRGSRRTRAGCSADKGQVGATRNAPAPAPPAAASESASRLQPPPTRVAY